MSASECPVSSCSIRLLTLAAIMSLAVCRCCGCLGVSLMAVTLLVVFMGSAPALHARVIEEHLVTGAHDDLTEPEGALLPTVVHLRALHFVDYLLIAMAITFISPLVLGGYALAASRARRFFRKPSSIRLLNRGAGTAMAGAAFVVAVQ